MNAVVKENPIPQDLSVTLAVTDEIRGQLETSNRAEQVALADAAAFEIDCNELAEHETETARQEAQRIDQLKALQKKFVQPAKDIIETANSLFNPAIASLTRSREIRLGRVKIWMQKEQARIEQEKRQREEEERRIRQEAEQKAAAERARAEQEAEAERRCAEEAAARQRAAEEKGDQEAATTAAAEAAQAEERANAALENGAARAQEAVIEAAATVSAAPVVMAAKPTGAVLRDNWVADLKPGVTEDQAKAAIAAATASRPELLSLLKLDMSAIHKMAKAQKQHMNIPGFQAKNDKQIAGRRK